MQKASGAKQRFSGQTDPRAAALQYAAAVVLVGAALALRLLLDPIWKDRLPFGTFFVAFLVIAQFAEAGPSALTCLAGYFLGIWFFAEPRHAFFAHSRIDWINSLFYFALCLLFFWLSQRARRALRREQEARGAVAQLAAIIESSGDAIVGNTFEGKIVSWNAGAQELYGFTPPEALGQSMDLLLPPAKGEDFGTLLQRVADGKTVNHFETVRRRKSGALVEVSLMVSPVRDSKGQIVGASTIARDISEWKLVERERESLVGELQAALAEVKTLSGMLPICSHCKKIRDDKGYWNQIEHYVHKHSNASFTHGICPDCADHLYPEVKGELQEQKP